MVIENMKVEVSYLDFFTQVEKMLGSTGNRLAKINMVLIMLVDYFNVRNPLLLVRDSVTNSFNIELAPELSQGELNMANDKFGAFISHYKRRFDYEQILFSGDAKSVPLVLPDNLEGHRMAFASFPIRGNDKNLQTGILIAYLPETERLAEKSKLMKVLAGYLGFYLDSTGSIPRRLYKSSPDDFPMALEGVVGESPAMKQIGETVGAVATSRAAVFIRGESGTGKEMIARNIHNRSLRNRAPFISVNCAAISENLLLNELFGHEKGAFTGADTTTKGRFEAANGGTLFLDEIGESSLNFQAKLLRVLQEGEFERLGSSKTIKVDVRIVCATNADIESLVRKRLFREDLYYRLNVLPIWVPSLSERREDIPVLARYFLSGLNLEYGKMVILTDDQAHLLAEAGWPGNVRELQSFMHRAFLMEQGGRVDVEAALAKREHLPAYSEPPQSRAEKSLEGFEDLELEEKKAIEKALRVSGGVQVKAARMLGVTLRQLRYRIKKYGVIVRKINA